MQTLCQIPAILLIFEIFFPEKFRLQWITLFYCEFIKTFIDKLVRQDLKEEKPFIADEVESFACNAGGNLVDIKMTGEI